MKPIIIAIFTSMALCLSSISRAADWWVINISQESIIFIDMESIKNDGNNRKSWVQYYVKTGESSKVLYLFKCEDEELGIKATYNYKSDGSFESDSANEYVSYKPAAPESVGYDIVRISCADDPRSAVNEEWQRPLKDEVSPSEFSRGVFKILEEDKTPAIGKKPVKSKG